MQPRIQDQAVGRWLDILPALGIDRKFLQNHHGPCPTCGGSDRFRWDNKGGSGSFYCSQCGPGGGVDLIMKFKGWDFITAKVAIERLIPSSQVHIPKAAREGDAQSRMISSWQHASPIRDGDVVCRWLEGRGIAKPGAHWPTQLRFTINALYAHSGGVKSYHPAMIAKFVAPNLSTMTLHRTFLDDDGHKADLPEVRQLAAGKVPAGGAVRLMPSGDTLGIAEGIETALAASQLFHLPVWACLNAGLLQKWEPPKTVKRVVIFADNDPSYAGQAAAYGLAYKLQSAFDVEVRTPDNPGDDWNDILCRDMGLPRPGSRKTPKETRHVDRNETSEVVHY